VDTEGVSSMTQSVSRIELDRRARHASRTLVALSKSDDLAEAESEWRYAGRYEDHGGPFAICDLCGKQNLRYQFEIQNRVNGQSLLVGSRCVLLFGIEGNDEIRREYASLVGTYGELHFELEAEQQSLLFSALEQMGPIT
jgi:hypothetical protein